ncbi:MAG: RelA/SpoT family protein [Saprospiraceae bacterium]
MPHSTESITTDEIWTCNDAYGELVKNLAPKLKGNDQELLDAAYDLALNAHMFQRRKSGEPYILHPIAVARICHEEIGLGPTAVICALLHDVVEDTPIELEEIFNQFGPKVTRIVDGLTKLDGLYNVGDNNAENLKKVLSTLVEDVRVVLIKMADRIHNLRTIGAMPVHKQIKIAAETEFIYAPLAHRLGLYKVKSEFEDIILKITDPEVYLELTEEIKTSEKERQKFINTFLQPIKKKIDEIRIPYRTQGRVKSISSIYQKIQKKNVPFDKIYDIFAIRIIIDVPLEEEKKECWHVYSVITDFYKPIPERLKDWITSPKGNGYESLHTTIIGPKGRFVEVQIRTERMDDIAERGFAAHWKYKGQKTQNSVYDGWLNNIRTLLDNQEGGDAIDFLNDFKTNLFKKEVYVFTPNGEMRILPLGATALDFAFDIHSDIGIKAASIKVNGKLVPMGYNLVNGDQITVNTSKNQKPNKDWLNIVVTGKARSKIRQSLNSEKKVQAELGKEMLQRKFKSLKIDFEENIDFLVSHYSYRNRVDFYSALVDEHVKTSGFKKFNIEGGKFSMPKEKEIITEKNEAQKISKKKKKKKKPQLVVINEALNEQYDYHLASCCNPVKGDEIFAFVSSTQGMKIHRKNCKNASNLFTNYGYRILKAEWQGMSRGDYIVHLRIIGLDTGIGVIQSITNEISSKQGLNIKSFSIAGDEGVFEGSISLKVRNLDQLNKLIKKLKTIDGINSVNRITTVE